MANRISLGEHDGTFGHGLFISRPGFNVNTDLDAAELIFSSNNSNFGAGIAEVLSTTASSSSSFPITVNYSTTYSNIPYILAVHGTGTPAEVGLANIRFQLPFPFTDLARTAFHLNVYTNRVIIELNSYAYASYPIDFSIAVFQGST